MSISGALNNAISGLTASSRAAQTVSDNLANAITEGYGRRELSLSPDARGAGGGVQVLGVTRDVQPGLISDRRLSDAALGDASTQANFLERMENLAGTPDEPTSLSARMAQFDAALIAGASRPDSQQRLQAVVNAAESVVGEINRVSEGIQALRREAETSIEAQVNRLNTQLERVADLNKQISSALNQGKSTAALEDLRQQTIDGISEIIPLREAPRDRGAVALFSTTGAILLDGSPAEFEFEASAVVNATTTVDNGQLTELRMNGRVVDFDAQYASLAGGTLGADFAVRDELSTTYQSQIDAVARDLIERFQDPNVDPTLGPTDAGLFTDAGNALDPLTEVGLASRIAVSDQVDPSVGGLWKLRDGFGAMTPGDVGNSTLLQSFSDALTELRVPNSGSFGIAERDASQLAATFASQVSLDRSNSEAQLSFLSTTQSELRDLELRAGVDSDAEMQKLLLIEQTYAANARMIRAAEEMFDTLTRL